MESLARGLFKMIKLEFVDSGWTTIEGCLGCARGKRERSQADVKLESYGNASITCRCGKKYVVGYSVKPRTVDPVVRFDKHNEVRFHRMKIFSSGGYAI
jgi:hypothetical protein